MLRMYSQYGLLCLLLLTLVPVRANVAAWQAHLEAARRADEYDTRYDTREDWAHAVRHYRLAVKEAERFGPNDPRLADTLEQFALCYLHPVSSEEDRFEVDYRKRMEVLFLRARAIREAAFGKNAVPLAKSECMASLLCAMRDEELQAERHYQQAMKLLEKAGPQDAGLVVEVLDLAIWYHAEDREQEMSLLRQVLATVEQAYGKDDPRIASRLYLLADSLEDVKEAEELYRRALRNAEKAYGAGNPRCGDALYRLGTFLLAHERKAEGEACLAQALADAERAYGNEDLRLLPTLYRLSGVQWPLPDLEDLNGRSFITFHPRAEDYLRRAAGIAVKAGDRVTQIEAWDRLAIYYRYKGRDEDAWRPLEAALQAAETAYGTDDPRILPALYHLAAWSIADDPVNALPLYRRAVAIVDKAYPNDLAAIEHLLHIAGIYANAGMPKDALALQQRAADILTASPDADPDELTNLLLRIAEEAPPALGSTDISPTLTRAIACAEKAYGPDSFEMAMLLQAIIDPPDHIRMAPSPEPYLHRLAGILPKVYPADSQELIWKLERAAELLGNAGNLKDALAVYREALAVADTRHDFLAQAGIAASLGSLYRQLGEVKEAETFMKRAVTLCEETDAEDLEVRLSELAQFYRHEKEFAKADAVYGRLYAVQVRQAGSGTREAMQALLSRAACSRAAGRYADAVKYLQQALKSADMADPSLLDYNDPVNLLGTILAERYLTFQAWGKPAETAACLQRLRDMATGKNEVLSFLGRQGLLHLIDHQGSAGRQQEVIDFLLILLPAHEAWFSKEHPQVTKLLLQLGSAYAALNDTPAADACYTRALQIEEARDAQADPRRQSEWGLSKVAAIYREQKRYTEEEGIWRRRLERERAHYGDVILAYRQTLLYLSETLTLQAKYAEAETLLLPLLAAERTMQAKYKQETPCDLLLAIGKLYHAWGKPEQAEPYLREAFLKIESKYGESYWSGEFLPSAEAYTAVLHALKRDDEVKPLDARIAAIHEEETRYQRQRIVDEYP